MTFRLRLELLEPEDRLGRQAAENGARAAGTPFLSFFAPPEMLAPGPGAGFKDSRHVSADTLNQRYLAGRTDGLLMAREDLLAATT